MFCSNCGQIIPDDSKFCPFCGMPIAPISAEPQPQPVPEPQQAAPQPVPTPQPDPVPQPAPVPAPEPEPIQAEEIYPNKMEKTLAIEAYLGILVLAPLFGAKESKFAHFHVTQGFNLFLIGLAFYILIIVNSTLGGIALMEGALWLYWILTVINCFYYLIEVAVTVFSIIGIINVIKNKMKALPLIGKLKIIK